MLTKMETVRVAENTMRTPNPQTVLMKDTGTEGLSAILTQTDDFIKK